MPHRTFAQVAKRRLVGKEGRERIREVNALLAELPDYRNGPYADLRKWLLSEIEESRVRSSAVPWSSPDATRAMRAATSRRSFGSGRSPAGAGRPEA